MHLERLSIIGVGLLGGSVAMAVKASGVRCHIVGCGHRQTTLDKAIEVGAIDEGLTDPAKAAAEADLVLLCTPVGLFNQMLRQIAPALRPGAIVTDVGSTKRSIVSAAHRLLPKGVRFVGSHPMAGSEKRGVEFARPDLFAGAVCITTPTRSTDAESLETVEEFWRMLGMRLTRLSPSAHDRLLAQVSHLPHAVAAAMVAIQSREGLGLAGKGFLDTTRIAGGDGALWRDIFLDNRDNLRSAIGQLKKKLDIVLRMLDQEDGAELAKWLDSAAGRRSAVLQQKLSEVTPD